MLISIYKNINKVLYKEHCYEAYKVLFPYAEEYDKLTRKKMVDECIALYKENPNIINYLFNEEELDYLYNLPDKIKNDDRRKIREYVRFFLYTTDDIFNDYTITLELEDVIKEAKRLYTEGKNIIEKEKEFQYVSVGIFRAYGALKPKEYYGILKKLQIENKFETEDNYYLNRFVTFDPYVVNSILTLHDLFGYTQEIILSHPKDIYLSQTKNQYKNIGCHYFDKENPSYKIAFKDKDIANFINKQDLNEIIIFAGAGLASSYFISCYERFMEQIDDKQRGALMTFLSSLPKYIMQRNQNNILSEADGDLFYKIMMPFIEFAGRKYKLPFDYKDTKYNGIQANTILKKCVEGNFNIVNDYLKANKLDEEAISILKSLKKAVYGPFIVLKHLKNGSVFGDKNNNLYLVKGIKNSIESMDYLSDLPTVCDTFLFQFKDNIIYSSVLIPFQVQIVGNMKRSFMDMYNSNKNKIITRIE